MYIGYLYPIIIVGLHILTLSLLIYRDVIDNIQRNDLACVNPLGLWEQHFNNNSDKVWEPFIRKDW